MSGLHAFLNQNAVKDENIKCVVSKRFINEDGRPVEWEICGITSVEDEKIRRSCMKQIPVQGAKNQYTKDLDSEKYLGLLSARCTVYPNLNDADLQNSYGVMGADTLLKSMLKPGEYQEYLKQIQRVNGFDLDINELVEDAKN